MTDDNQPRQLSLAEARIAGEDGLALAVGASSAEWLEAARHYVYRCCLENPTLICDDVWALGLTSNGHDRAFGSAMKHGVRQGWMRATGKTRPSIRSHGSQKPVYQSLIFRGGVELDQC